MQYGNADDKDKHDGLCDVSDTGQNNGNANFDSDDDSQPMPVTSESVKVKWKSVLTAHCTKKVKFSTVKRKWSKSDFDHSN